MLCCSGLSPEQADLRYLENAKRLDLYGVHLQQATVCSCCIYLNYNQTSLLFPTCTSTILVYMYAKSLFTSIYLYIIFAFTFKAASGKIKWTPACGKNISYTVVQSIIAFTGSLVHVLTQTWKRKPLSLFQLKTFFTPYNFLLILYINLLSDYIIIN